MIGQDPDTIQGHYDKFQAFRGTISELNFWDHVLTADNIRDMAACQHQPRGNIIAWEENNFKLNIVEADDLTDKIFCTPKENRIIFPKKYSYSSAVTLCKAHGGYLFTPKNTQMNQDLLEEVGKYLPECLENATGNVLWLGGTTKNFKLVLNESIWNVSQNNFTNWKIAPYWKDNNCILMDSSGKWLPLKDCSGVRHCPVCGFVGHPMLTFKGKSSCSIVSIRTTLLIG